MLNLFDQSRAWKLAENLLSSDLCIPYKAIYTMLEEGADIKL